MLGLEIALNLLDLLASLVVGLKFLTHLSDEFFALGRLLPAEKLTFKSMITLGQRGLVNLRKFVIRLFLFGVD